MGRSRKTATPPRQITSTRPTKSLRWVDCINLKQAKEGSSKKSSLVISKPPQQPLPWAPPGRPRSPCEPFFLDIAEPRADIIPQPPDLTSERDILLVPRRQWQGEELWSQLRPPRWGTGPISTQPEGSSLLTRTFQRREARPRPPNWGRWPPISFLSPCMDSMARLGRKVHF